MRPATLIMWWLAASGPVLAGDAEPDFEREQRLAAEIEDAILDGDPVYLEADGREFLAIYTESETEQPLGAVLVLHGRGFHPDWQEVAYPLRVGLVEHGWHTLSLQMPVLEKNAKYYDYVPIFGHAFPRIEAGIAYLRQQGAETVVIAAHSCSVHMTMAWLEARGDASIDGFAGIGMGATDYQQPMAKPFPLAQLSVPVLDLYGDQDYPAVQRMAPQRLADIQRAGNPRSRQIVAIGADHYFKNEDDQLLEIMADWLQGVHD